MRGGTEAASEHFCTGILLIAVCRGTPFGWLAELEAGFAVEKAKVEAMKARLFARLGPHFQFRNPLRDIIRYRRKFLEMLVRHGEEEAAQVQEEYRQASAHGAARFKPPLKRLRRRSTLSGKAGHWLDWKRKMALRAVVETAAGSGAAPWESIELEIVREAINDLRESRDYELHRLTEQSPEFFDETVGRHLESLETELAALQSDAEMLAGEVEELTGEHVAGLA